MTGLYWRVVPVSSPPFVVDAAEVPHGADIDIEREIPKGCSFPAPATVVREFATKAGIDKLAAHGWSRTCARLCHAAVFTRQEEDSTGMN